MNNTDNTSNEVKRLDLTICGGEHDVVELDEVLATETPETTYREKLSVRGERVISHQPIAHSKMIDLLRGELDSRDFTVVNECHNLAKEGKRYFGLFQVNHNSRGDNGDRGTVIGLRNAHDKAFSAGICAGDAPFVCDNLIFSNDVVVARKHVGDYENLISELVGKISGALGQVFSMWTKQDERVQNYKEREIGNTEAHDLIIRAYKANAINLQKIPDVLNQWESSDHVEFWDRNVNSLYNAFTEVYKGNLFINSNPSTLVNRSDGLHSVLDPFVGLNYEEEKTEEVSQATVEELVGAA